MQEIVDARGSLQRRFYLVQWEGFAVSQSTWEPVKHLDKQAKEIAAYWDAHPEMEECSVVPDGDWEHRCEWCCEFCVDESRLKAHKSRCAEKPRSKVGTRAERAALRKKSQKAQEAEEAVVMSWRVLDNVFVFRYLGVDFQADRSMRHAVDVRMGMASGRFQGLWCVWGHSALCDSAKHRLFEAAVVSVLIYGCEAWDLTEGVMKLLRDTW